MYFKLIFCVLYKDQISFFCMRIATFSTIFVEETVFSFVFLWNSYRRSVVYAWIYFYFLFCCSVLYFHTYPGIILFYYYCSFVIYLILRSVRSPDLFLKIPPVIVCILCFYINFRIIFSISVEKSLGFW